MHKMHLNKSIYASDISMCLVEVKMSLRNIDGKLGKY